MIRLAARRSFVEADEKKIPYFTAHDEEGEAVLLLTCLGRIISMRLDVPCVTMYEWDNVELSSSVVKMAYCSDDSVLEIYMCHYTSRLEKSSSCSSLCSMDDNLEKFIAMTVLNDFLNKTPSLVPIDEYLCHCDSVCKVARFFLSNVTLGGGEEKPDDRLLRTLAFLATAVVMTISRFDDRDVTDPFLLRLIQMNKEEVHMLSCSWNLDEMWKSTVRILKSTSAENKLQSLVLDFPTLLWKPSDYFSFLIGEEIASLLRLNDYDIFSFARGKWFFPHSETYRNITLGALYFYFI